MFYRMEQIITEIWKDRSYEQIEGRLTAIDEEITDTKLYMMGRITAELVAYQKHLIYVNWWKKVWKYIKENLNENHVIIRWDR